MSFTWAYLHGIRYAAYRKVFKTLLRITDSTFLASSSDKPDRSTWIRSHNFMLIFCKTKLYLWFILLMLLPFQYKKSDWARGRLLDNWIQLEFIGTNSFDYAWKITTKSGLRFYCPKISNFNPKDLAAIEKMANEKVKICVIFFQKKIRPQNRCFTKISVIWPNFRY